MKAHYLRAMVLYLNYRIYEERSWWNLLAAFCEAQDLDMDAVLYYGTQITETLETLAENYAKRNTDKGDMAG